jgi:predicted metal-dependent phosphoesterase TrpH
MPDPVAPTFDLQSHSSHSDGDLAPADVVARAAQAGIELLALTDHDTVDGVDEARAAGPANGVRVVPAVELSAMDRGKRDLHILGYCVDHHDAAFAASLAEYRRDRERRAVRMAQALRDMGFTLEDAAIEVRRAAGKPVGRPHLADAVTASPANAPRLAAEGVDEPAAFLEAYLIEGRPAYRTREIPSVEEAVRVIHAAGGVAVWAHPFWDLRDPEDVLDTIDRFRVIGIDGVEAFYVTHTRAQTELVADRCTELGMLTTGSSDFHGPGHRVFSRFRAHQLYGRTAALGPIAAS